MIGEEPTWVCEESCSLTLAFDLSMPSIPVWSSVESGVDIVLLSSRVCNAIPRAI